MQPMTETPWHHLPADEVVQRLDASPEHGLDPAEAERRAQQYGPNALVAHKGTSPLLLFAQQFHQPLIYILSRPPW